MIGATYLRMMGFEEKVANLVEGHVLDKRYQCLTEDGYYEKLSAGSKRTLMFQGGVMCEEEAAVFRQPEPIRDRKPDNVNVGRTGQGCWQGNATVRNIQKTGVGRDLTDTKEGRRDSRLFKV